MFNPAAYKRSVFLMHGFFDEAFAKPTRAGGYCGEAD
jgi:hypothetical protein